MILVDADIPAGNILVDAIEGDLVRLRQDLRDTDSWWFHWSFRVRGAAGRTLTFRFEQPSPIGVRGPAVSKASGDPWRWLGSDSVRDAEFTYAFGPGGDQVCFAFAFPYLESNLRRFLARNAASPNLRSEQLCLSRKGRPVEVLHVGWLDGGAQSRVVLTCRHHACESMASFALEGLMDEVLLGHDAGAWLREHVEFLVVPFVDKDGVEDGDQGKCRRPHDHNRDYQGESIYPETQAIRELVPAWSGGRLRVALDLHCPWIRGNRNEDAYFVGLRHPRQWEQVQVFSRILESSVTGPLPFSGESNLPFGVGWNQPASLGPGKSCARWMYEIGGAPLSATLELPYANAGGAEVNADSAPALGRDLAAAIREYLG